MAGTHASVFSTWIVRRCHDFGSQWNLSTRSKGMVTLSRSVPLVSRSLTANSASRMNRAAAVLMVIGLAVASLGLTGCEPPGNMPSDPPSIVGVWDVYQYRVFVTGSSEVDLADDSDITARFTESPRSFFFAYDPALQGIGPPAELAARDGTYVQHESRKTLTLTGHQLTGEHATLTCDYTLGLYSLRLHHTRMFLHCTNGSCQSRTRTVTIMARKK